MNAEQHRLEEARQQSTLWKKWGPYLSERQWGTVREDYSENGNAWDYFSHDQARSRAYHWGEDGLAGISDDKRVAEEISRRLGAIFLKGQDGNRPVNGGEKKLQEDPHWRDYIQFYEYFHRDNGTGLGANHQTGWTGVIARGMHLFATTIADQALELGKLAAVVKLEKSAGSGPAAQTVRSRN